MAWAASAIGMRRSSPGTADLLLIAPTLAGALAFAAGWAGVLRGSVGKSGTGANAPAGDAAALRGGVGASVEGWGFGVAGVGALGLTAGKSGTGANAPAGEVAALRGAIGALVEGLGFGAAGAGGLGLSPGRSGTGANFPEAGAVAVRGVALVSGRPGMVAKSASTCWTTQQAVSSATHDKRGTIRRLAARVRFNMGRV